MFNALQNYMHNGACLSGDSRFEHAHIGSLYLCILWVRSCSRIHSPWLGDKVNSGTGLSYKRFAGTTTLWRNWLVPQSGIYEFGYCYAVCMLSMHRACLCTVQAYPYNLDLVRVPKLVIQIWRQCGLRKSIYAYTLNSNSERSDLRFKALKPVFIKRDI